MKEPVACLFCAKGLELLKLNIGKSAESQSGIVECENCGGKFGLNDHWQPVCAHIDCPLCERKLVSTGSEFYDEYLRFDCEECSAKENTCYFMVDRQWNCHFIELECPACTREWATHWKISDGQEFCPCCEHRFIIDREGRVLSGKCLIAACPVCEIENPYSLEDVNQGPVPCPNCRAFRGMEDGEPVFADCWNVFDLDGDLVCPIKTCPGYLRICRTDNSPVALCSVCKGVFCIHQSSESGFCIGVIDPFIPCPEESCLGWLLASSDTNAELHDCAICGRRFDRSTYLLQESMVEEWTEEQTDSCEEPPWRRKTNSSTYNDDEWEERLKVLPEWKRWIVVRPRI